MCLNTNQPFPFVALRDKKVFKVVRKGNTYRMENLSPFFSLLYRENCGYEANLKATFAPRYWSMFEINEGLHAYTSKWRAEKWIGKSHYEYKVVEVTVPKGALYYRGGGGEIVSNKLVTKSLEAVL